MSGYLFTIIKSRYEYIIFAIDLYRKWFYSDYENGTMKYNPMIFYKLKPFEITIRMWMVAYQQTDATSNRFQSTSTKRF